MKIEIGEKAAIQALRDCLKEIPFLQLMKISIAENAPGPDFRMDVHIQMDGTQLLTPVQIYLICKTIAVVDRRPPKPSKR